MKKLTKKDLYPMILKQARILTGKLHKPSIGTIQELIKAKNGGYVSRELLGTLLTSDKKMQPKTAVILADFLGIDSATIETHVNAENFKPLSERKEKAYAWEFDKQQQGLIDLSKVFFRILDKAGSAA